MQNQIVFFQGNASDNPTKDWQVQAASTVITSGQPAILGTAPYVVAAPTASPVIGTHVVAGFSNGISSQTASADGTADLYVPLQYAVLMLPALNPSLIATQSLYDTYVNTAVLWDLTSGVYTVDVSTTGPISGTNGLIVVDLDVANFPGMVAFVIRQTATWTQ